MSIKLSINGFGRIGRLAFRRASEDPQFEVVAINDLTDAATLVYLLKYDSAHGRFGGEDLKVSDDGNGIVYKGKYIPILNQPDPKLIKWSDFGVDIVLECTGRFKGKEDASVHVEVGGAKGVIISAPADEVTPTVVFGVNENILKKDMTVISGASCTTNCLAPVAFILNQKFGIVSGFMTTVHAYTNDQTTLDLVKKGNLRRGRAAAANIVPSSTGAAKALGLVIPELTGKLDGGALRVPVIDGSLVDLTVNLNAKVDKKIINASFKEAAKGAFKGIMGYTEDEVVSSDIISTTEGSIFDATQTKVITTKDGGQIVKVVSWYDNEYGYTCQFIRLAAYYAKVLGVK